MKHTIEEHVRLKHDPDLVRETCVFLGVQDWGFQILELWNCSCGTTISIQGIGPLLA